MQLAGPGVLGPPRDRNAAVAVLREALAGGVNHIDTSDFYGPHITNQIIREALAPYAKDLVIVTKIGAKRSDTGGWLPAFSAAELTQAVHDNLRNLGLNVLEVVNLRIMFDAHGPAEGSIEALLTALADLQRQGLVRHIGLSNVTSAQVAQGREICRIACVQNQYNLVHRNDDALIDDLAKDGIAYVPFFPLGGFTPLQSSALSDIAQRLGTTPMQVALAWPCADHPTSCSSRGPRRSGICVRTWLPRCWSCPRMQWRSSTACPRPWSDSGVCCTHKNTPTRPIFASRLREAAPLPSWISRSRAAPTCGRACSV